MAFNILQIIFVVVTPICSCLPLVMAFFLFYPSPAPFVFLDGSDPPQTALQKLSVTQTRGNLSTNKHIFQLLSIEFSDDRRD